MVWPAVLLIYAALLPMELVVRVGDFNLYAYRIALFIAVPGVALQLIYGRVKLGLVDGAILFSGLWMAISFGQLYGLAKGIERGGVLGFDLVMAYFVGRCYIKDVKSLRRAIRFSVPGVVIAGGTMLLESLSGTLIVRPTLASWFGNVEGESAVLRNEVRLGLTRAYGPFPHPILGGLHLTSFLPLFVAMLQSSWTKVLAVASASFGIFALSSAVFISMAQNTLLVVYDLIQKRVKGLGWSVVVYGAVALLVALHIFSTNGVLGVLVRYATLEANTGFYRLSIWEFGSMSVANHPWFGTGFEYWLRPAWMTGSSVDAHWLLLAMRFGLPAAIGVGAATAATIIMLGLKAGKQVDPCFASVYVAVCISLVTLSMLMFTVTLWGNSYAWFSLLLGSGAGLVRTGRSNSSRPYILA